MRQNDNYEQGRYTGARKNWQQPQEQQQQPNPNQYEFENESTVGSIVMPSVFDDVDDSRNDRRSITTVEPYEAALPRRPSYAARDRIPSWPHPDNATTRALASPPSSSCSPSPYRNQKPGESSIRASYQDQTEVGAPGYNASANYGTSDNYVAPNNRYTAFGYHPDSKHNSTQSQPRCYEQQFQTIPLTQIAHTRAVSLPQPAAAKRDGSCWNRRWKDRSILCLCGMPLIGTVIVVAIVMVIIRLPPKKQLLGPCVGDCKRDLEDIQAGGWVELVEGSIRR